MGNLIVPVVRRENKPRHGEVKQLASDHTAFRQLSQSLNTDILSGNMCYGNRGKEMITSVQSLSRVRLFATPWAAARQASLSITNSRSVLKLMSIESVMPSNHLILWCPLLLPHQGLFQWVGSSHQVAEVLELLSISPCSTANMNLLYSAVFTV